MAGDMNRRVAYARIAAEASDSVSWVAFGAAIALAYCALLARGDSALSSFGLLATAIATWAYGSVCLIVEVLAKRTIRLRGHLLTGRARVAREDYREARWELALLDGAGETERAAD